MWDANVGYRNSSVEDMGTSSVVVLEAEGQLQRTKVRGLRECLGVGVQGRGFGDITTVDRTKGKGLRGEMTQRHWERSKGGHLWTLGRTQRRSQGGDV